VSSVHRSDIDIERVLHVETTDVQLDGKTAVTEGLSVRLSKNSSRASRKPFLDTSAVPSPFLFVLLDPVEDPPVGVRAGEALSLLEQASRSPRENRRVLVKDAPSAKHQRGRRCRRLDPTVSKNLSPLTIELEPPPHSDLPPSHGMFFSARWSCGMTPTPPEHIRSRQSDINNLYVG
jgi:hypothetical protein